MTVGFSVGIQIDLLLVDIWASYFNIVVFIHNERWCSSHMQTNNKLKHGEHKD